MKKKFLILSVIALLCVSVLATWAYFNADETTTNVISTGEVDLDLYELDAEGTRYDEGMSFENVMPGMVLYKEPIIENLDETQAFYTRAAANIKVTAADGSTLSSDCVELNIGSDWQYADGWYYYKGEVAPGGKVSFFTNVTFAEHMGNAYQNCDVKIEVIAQAVQVKNNELQGDDYTKITGWSEN